MLLISGSPIPFLPDSELVILAKQWQDAILTNLCAKQIAHISSFGNNHIQLRCSRLLVRMLALEAVHNRLILSMDNRGRPFFVAQQHIPLSFSHAPNAAFCAIYTSYTQNPINLAIDAENYNCFNTQGMALFFGNLTKSKDILQQLQSSSKLQLLQLWQLYEIIIKLYGIKIASKYLSSEKNILKISAQKSTSILIGKQKIFLKFISCYEYCLCLGASENIFSQMSTYWTKHPILLLSNKK